MPARQPDLVVLGVAVAAVSASAPLVRAADAPAIAIALWRNTLALPVLAVVALIWGRSTLGALRGPAGRHAVLAGVLLAAHFATWIPSLSFTTIASSVALVSTQPIWAAVLARLRGETVSRDVWVGIGVALLGVIVLTGVDVTVSARALAGDGLALLGGAFAAGYVTAGADARRQLSTGTYAFVCYGIASIVLVAVAAASGQELTGYDHSTWLAIAAIVAGPQLLGHTLVNRVLGSLSATVVSVAILLEVVGASVLGRVFFDETPPAGAIPAAALVIVGVILVVRADDPRGLPPWPTAPTD